MKRTYTLVVLLGLVIGALVTGCNDNTASNDASKATNAAATAVSTNK